MQITGLKKEEEEERAFIDLFLILRVILSTSTEVSPSIFLITELILLWSPFLKLSWCFFIFFILVELRLPLKSPENLLE